MARGILIGAGGSGADLDAITAQAGDVIKGKVIVDNEGEPLTGTLQLTGSANPEQVLANYTFYKDDPKTKKTGNIPVRTSQNSSLNAGGSRTISKGYYPSDFTVSGNSLSSQTPGDAGANHILSGKKAWVNGSLVTGTMAIQSILSFSAAPYGAKMMSFNWTNPAKGPFSGIIIVYKTGGYPTSMSDGTRIYKGSGSNSAASGKSYVNCEMPSGGTTYYFRAAAYVTKDGGEWIDSSTLTATASTRASTYVFTSSGEFLVPAGVSYIDIFCAGGGGGGSRGHIWRSNGIDRISSGTGGAGGYTSTLLNYRVYQDDTLAITIGAGGLGARDEDSPTSGGQTSVVKTASPGSPAEELITADGGRYGVNTRDSYFGAKGGSGGPEKRYCRVSDIDHPPYYIPGYYGGSNGGDGGGSNGGAGQGTTTRAFGESSGTLYCGAGGGAYAASYGAYFRDMEDAGLGGAGGGGNPGTFIDRTMTQGSDAAAGTGGGGGGGVAVNGAGVTMGGHGAGGIVIIRIK